MKSRSVLAALFIAVLVWLFPAVFAGAAGIAELVEAAKKEGEVIFVGVPPSITGPKGFQAIGKAFNKKYGLDLKVTYTPMNSFGRMSTRVMQEAASGRMASTDLFLGTEGHIVNLRDVGALRSFPWRRYFPFITDEMIAFDGEGVVVASFFPGVFYNMKLVPRPRVLDDVFNPKWKGKIGASRIFGTYADMGLAIGEEKMDRFVKRLAEYSAGIVSSGAEEAIVSGEFVMVLPAACQNTEPLREKGAPVDCAVFEDVPSLTLWHMGIPKTAAHPQAAALLLGFLASDDGQKLFWEAYGRDSPFVKSAYTYKTVQALRSKGIQVIPSFAQRAKEFQEKSKELEKRYQKMMRAEN